jgi:4-oxalocrotonate tautomerase
MAGQDTPPPSTTVEEKSALIAGAGRLLLDVLHTPLDSTVVVAEEMPTENRGCLGFRKRRGSSP